MTDIVLPFDKSPKTYGELLDDLILLRELLSGVAMVKIGLEAMNANFAVDGIPTSAAIMARMHLGGDSILWDQKIDDIGNTSAKTIANLVGSVRAVTMHASTSYPCLVAAAKAREEALAKHGGPFTIFGVTVLTDFASEDCVSVFGDTPEKKVVEFAKRLTDAGIGGIVCSGRELRAIREAGFRELITLVPGIRPAWADKGDQQRVVTPGDAVMLGADYIVIGRPIMEAEDPVAALERTHEEMRAAM